MFIEWLAFRNREVRIITDPLPFAHSLYCVFRLCYPRYYHSCRRGGTPFGVNLAVFSFLRRVQGGGQPPCRGSGCPRKTLSHLLRAACGGAQERKKSYFGGSYTLSPRQRSPNPGRGAALPALSLSGALDRKVRHDSCFE